MKTTFTRTCAMLVLLSPVTVSIASAEDQDRPVIALNTVQQEVPGLVLARGASEKEVSESLGQPGQLLARNVWVYFDYEAARPTHNQTHHDALVVTFSSGKVVDMRLVERADVGCAHGKDAGEDVRCEVGRKVSTFRRRGFRGWHSDAPPAS